MRCGQATRHNLRPPSKHKPQAPEIQPEYVTEPDALDNLLNSVPDENTRRHIKQGLIEEYSRQQAQIEQARQAAVAHAEQARAAFEQQTVSAILTAEAAALAPFPESQEVRREQVQAGLSSHRPNQSTTPRRKSGTMLRT